jgi:alkanesulfonate monooxygenase SsuD/methylene tetrahydromethanopterin reductase-like flavin-dependent oxidoreductase (luciferase family)
MRFSFWISTDKPWAEILDLATHAESTGWDGLWLADHFMPNDDNALDQPMGECFSLLAGLAAAVPRVRLGSLVAGNTYRHPAVLAKQAASIDDISDGRFVLGVGAGWQENEHARYGIALGSISERIAWFEEACQVFVGLRDQDRTTVAGERYQLADAPLVPKPTGPMPLLIGSSGQHKMAAIVARYADEWNTWSTPSLWLEKRAGYDRALAEIGRDPSSLRRSTQALVLLGPDGKAKAEELAAIRPAIGGTSEQLIETIGQWAEAGLDELIVPSFTLGDIERTKDSIDQILIEVAPAFR